MSRRHDTLLLLTALVATIAYSVADANVGAFLIGVLGILGVWGIVRARGGSALSYAATIPMTLAAVGYALIRLAGEGFRVSVFSEFVLALIIVKMGDRRTSRDTGQALLLSVFLVIGAILTSNRFELGVALLLFIPLVTAAVITQQIELVREAAGAERSLTRPPERTRLDMRRLVWSTSLASLAISIGIFVVMPRGVGVQAFGAWGNASIGAATGFNDEIDLGRGGIISQSATPVLDLAVFDKDGQPVGYATQSFLLRGAVLDQYERGSWRRSPPSRLVAGNAPRHIEPGEMWPPDRGPDSPRHDTSIRVTIRNTVQTESHLFTLWRPLRYEGVQYAQITRDADTGTFIRQGPPGKFEYIMHCRVYEEGEQIGGERGDSYPSFPASSRVRELAEQILEGVSIDPDPKLRPLSADAIAASEFKSYLQSNYAYTLQTERAPSGQDPIEWFLLGEEKRGHCEYFASAMAALCQSVGIEARVVTGFVASEWNPATMHYIVRESDAHAWVEVRTSPAGAGERWRVFDPTPVADFQQIHEPSQSLLAKVRRLIDTVEYTWINTVVGYNRSAGSRLVDASFDDRLGNFSEDLGERLRVGGVGLVVRSLAAGLIGFSTSMALGLLFVAIVRRRGWRPTDWWRALFGWLNPGAWLRRAPRQPEDAIRADLLRALDRAGLPKPAWRPLLTHARGAGEFSEPAARVAQSIYRAAFGGRPLDEEAAARARRDLASLRTRGRGRRGRA